MSKNNKNNIDYTNLSNPIIGNQRVNDIIQASLKNGNILPKPIQYRDIHQDVVRFFREEMKLVFDGQEVKTFYFTPQRFDEFTQTWEVVDENKQILSNIKIITREPDNVKGTIHEDNFNIPGNKFYTIGTSEKWDGNKNITVSYKMRQPYAVDFMYDLKLVTSNLLLIDIFNNQIHEKFKARQCYIAPNGHYMSIVLEDVADDSEYDLNERKIFIQTFKFKVMAYIINESDLLIEENITRALIGYEVDLKTPRVSTFSNSNLVVDFPIKSKNTTTFKVMNFYNITNVVLENIDSIDIIVNGDLLQNYTTIDLDKFDKLTIKITKTDVTKPSKVNFITN